ncbi:MAG: hypothetical protein K2J27_08510 [Duncaniella sp.]|nr:hypothetical protein [Duncaniella sp.]
MNTFDTYIHGTPRGHQIWGAEKNHDYINQFYNHDLQIDDKVFIQGDICAGRSFYTYIRRQNLFDVEGRPNAFFAITVSFNRAYCTNVFKLYKLFDAVYNQLCIGPIINQFSDSEKFIVPDFKVAHSGNRLTVEKIQLVLHQKIEELIVPYLTAITSGDTFNKAKRTFSLLDVDSPAFFDLFQKYSIIISPTIQSSIITYENISNNLKEVMLQRNTLLDTNNKLQLEISSLSQEKKSLSKQLHTSHLSTKKKYEAKIDQLQQDLNTITAERDTLKYKIDEASISFELIAEPIQKVSQVLAERFSEKYQEKVEEPTDSKASVSKKTFYKTWRNWFRYNWFNSMLLILIFICCCTILITVLKSKNTSSIFTEIAPAQIEDIKSYDITWEEYSIDIKDGGDNLRKNKKYTLRIMKDSNVVKDLNEEWEVWVNNNLMNQENTFLIPSDCNDSTVKIICIINGNPVKDRICKIQ